MKMTERSQALGKTHKLTLGISMALAAMTMLVVNPAMAEDQTADDQTPSQETDILEEVIVTGTRGLVRNSIEVKRESNTIVEALSVEDIGDIPALSIGEALETLTSAASHREQGGATEISIRGMGPFLGSTVINDREATNGSGDRSVNFSQFPAELFNKIEIYKTQQANLIEGGVSGQISLGTVKPLDYGKQRIQAEIKGLYYPDQNDIDGAKNKLGYRGTFSYVDQWESDSGSEFGLSVGIQTNQSSNPEQEYRTSSGWRDCRNDPNEDSGVYASGNCDSGSGDLKMEVDPETGVAPDEGTPFIMVPSQRTYRQNTTDDDRKSAFAALQWRPNDDWDINLDAQYSKREFNEIRNDLVFAEQRRVNPEGLDAWEDGTVRSFNNEGRIETLSAFQERSEKYKGIGLNILYQATDRLAISGDISYSNTYRYENIIHTRLQSEKTDIYGNPTPAGTDRPNAWYINDGGRADVGVVTVENFDVTNWDLFADSARTRIDRNQDRENTIKAGRLDFDLETNGGFITSYEFGLRYSELEYVSFPRARDQLTFSDDALAAANIACRNDFPESGFLSSPLNGEDMVTNVDEDGNVIDSGTGNTFATFDPICLANEFTDGDWDWPVPGQSVQNVDVTENTLAGYFQANYEGELWAKPIRGNFGLRVVNTDVDSKGLRTTFTTVENEDDTISVIEDSDNFTTVSGGSSYTEWLPSVNIVMDLDEDLLLRGGIFRGLSRPDPADLGYGRNFNVDDEDATSIDDLVGSAVAPGNPDLEPLTSWNYDIAIEWYPNEDTILAGGLYLKNFLGGFEQVVREESFQVDGQDVPAAVATLQTDNSTSTLWGYELSVAHNMSYLPGAWSGLGFKLGYNSAHSDFEFEDATYGAAVLADEDGNVLSERIGLIPPANLFGFSERVLSSQLYYGIGDWDFAIMYKYRSEYFQQFISSPGIVRFVAPNEVWEARITWYATDNLRVSFEALNIFDEPKKQRIPTSNSFSELNSYGTRLFFGVRGRW